MTDQTIDLSPKETGLLTTVEQHALGLRLILSMMAAGCLVIAGTVEFFNPDQQPVAELIAGVAAALVAGPALTAAWRSLSHPDLHGVMDQLIALAILAAWATGNMVTAALLPLVMTIGHILEERSLLGSQEVVRALGRLTQTKARRYRPDRSIEEVPAQHLRVGDIIEVRPGDIIPADGLVTEGLSSVDIASITGESIPVEVLPGAEVFNGSINLDGHLIVAISRVGAETTLGRVVTLLQEAERAKPPVTRLLERYAHRYLILILLLTAATWFVTGNSAVMLAVLVAACPAAIVLAAPATSIAAISVASRHGILVKGAAFLETLATVDSVALDKTGTVTIGHPQLASALPELGIAKQDLIATAANLGKVSNHPVSRALALLADPGSAPILEDIKETSGLGVVARDGGEIVALGRGALFDQMGIVHSQLPEHEGPSVGVSRGSQFLGWILLADEPRPEAIAAIEDLRQLGLHKFMLMTGDRWPAARAIAQSVGISDIHAELLPAEKMELILNETASGQRPLVVGDGINDALALKAGAVGIAMGAQGTDVALSSADLVLMTNDLRRLGTCIRLSRLCRRTIYTNVTIGLLWTMGVMICAVAGLLGPSGALLAALLQNFSILIVIVNAGRILKFQELLS